MRDRRSSVGRRGEELAAAFLITKGFTMIARNWRCRAGEIDLIVQRGDEVRFVEVKTRCSKTFGYPEEAVTYTKKIHFAKAVEWWLSTHQIPRLYSMDVVAISIDPRNTIDINWIEAIF